MRKLTLVFLLPTIGLFGCATRYIDNQSGMSNYQKDSYECELASRHNTIPQQYGILFDDMRYNGEKSDLYDRCLYSKGYYYYTK